MLKQVILSTLWCTTSLVLIFGGILATVGGIKTDNGYSAFGGLVAIIIGFKMLERA